MAMRPCNKCKGSQWSYEMPNAVTVKATCGKCGYSVEFTTPKLQRKANRVYPEFKPHFSREEIESQTGDPPW